MKVLIDFVSIYKKRYTKSIYKKEIDIENKPTVIKRKCNMAEGRDKSGAWEEHTHTTIHKIDNQQEPTM